MILGDYTTQYIGDFQYPMGESLLTKQYNGIRKGVLQTPQINSSWPCSIVFLGYLYNQAIDLSFTNATQRSHVHALGASSQNDKLVTLPLMARNKSQ